MCDRKQGFFEMAEQEREQKRIKRRLENQMWKVAQEELARFEARRIDKMIDTLQKINRHRFWMCFVDGKDAPKVKHYLLADAKQEAERLAKKTGKDVFVLWASAFVRYIPPFPEMEWQATIVNKEVDNGY